MPYRIRSGAKKAHGEEDPQGYELRLDLVQATEMAEPKGTEGEEESGDTASGPRDPVQSRKPVDEIPRGNEGEDDQRIVGCPEAEDLNDGPAQDRLSQHVIHVGECPDFGMEDRCVENLERMGCQAVPSPPEQEDMQKRVIGRQYGG